MHVKITNGTVDTYPYNVGQLRRDNPNTSFPRKITDDTLASYGLVPVTFLDIPTINDRIQKTEQESQPSLVDGVWTISWITSSKTSEETQAWDNDVAENNRATRSDLIAETDFYALSDVTMSNAMTAYRQALRDITSHSNWPNLESDDWPVKP